jgi:erythromycin esterase-like protein/predicted phosphoribosyltransferase
MIFKDRADAGRKLAARLTRYADQDNVLVLALPRGGVPVAYEVAKQLKAPLDVFLVRKLGVPGYEELAMGAIAAGGVRVINEELVNYLGIPDEVIDEIAAVEQRELERRALAYRDARPPPDIKDRIVILIDDGLATGSTMRAAAAALRPQKPRRIVVGVPVSSPETCDEFRSEVDEIVCVFTPKNLQGVGLWYEDFSQTSDEDVRQLLKGAAKTSSAVVNLIRENLHPLTGAASDYDPLIKQIDEARFVLIGEASHGTHEFYRERAQITKRLIQEKGFTAVAVEADWPDAYRVNRFVRGTTSDAEAIDSLAGFKRFPTWMWRNADVLDFIGWLRAHNDALPNGANRVGFYGLDLYSLHASIEAVLGYLAKVDPEAAKRARYRYSCFEHFGENTQAYGYAASFDLTESCESEVVSQLIELRKRAGDYASRDGRVATDDFFFAEQNARLVKNAEEYYRSMFRGSVRSWNLRDRHMAETLESLVVHLEKQGPPAKVVVWEHNSHLGDARATEMGERGELNVGQLVRERHGRDAVLVGFSTYSGTVTAASDWDAPAERKRVRPALRDSYEALFHEVGIPRFQVSLGEGSPLVTDLREPRLERAIGVIYRLKTERQSHYFYARVADQFDALLHFDETRAVEPLERTPEWNVEEVGEAAETFPSGL